MRKNALTFFTAAIAVFAFILIGFLIYFGAFKNNVKKQYELLIHQGNTMQMVIDSLKSADVLYNFINFELVSQILNFKNGNLKEGRYLLKTGMTNYQIISKIRSGAQDPLKVTINNVRDVTELSGKISRYLLLDSIELDHKLKDSTFTKSLGYTVENILSLFIPNTYEMYWNISIDKLIQKMQKEHDRFWQDEMRISKANSINLNQIQVYTLASIVEKESNYEPERPTIAGVYLNRLKSNMKLQADPTVVFALGVNGLQRVLLEHLLFESPYNTYLVEGLPPGPIYMPSINSIDAVLNAEKHDFIFFCAKEGYEGRHSFASTLQQHSINARNYQKWLNRQHIK